MHTFFGIVKSFPELEDKVKRLRAQQAAWTQVSIAEKLALLKEARSLALPLIDEVCDQYTTVSFVSCCFIWRFLHHLNLTGAGQFACGETRIRPREALIVAEERPDIYISFPLEFALFDTVF